MAKTVLAVCTHCEAKLRVSATSAGKKVRCPKCSEAFRVPAGQDDRDEEVRPAKRAVDPPHRAEMVERRTEEDDEADRPRRRIGRGDDDANDRAPRMVRRRADDDEDERPRRRKKRRAQTSMLPWLIGGGVVLLLLVVGGIVALVLILKSSKSTNYEKYEAVVKEMIDILNTMSEAFESIKDKESAKQAAVKINDAYERFLALDKRVASLPKLSRSDDQALQKKYDAELDKTLARFKRAGSGHEKELLEDPDLLKAVMRMADLEKDCPNLTKIGKDR
jgi:predicted Zn finger-like uncharacterized protein